MSKEDNILKIDEVRKLIKEYKRAELESVAEALYKMLTKSQKLDNNIAELLQNPDKKLASNKAKKSEQQRPFAEVKAETLWFVDNAYKQNFFAPNRIVPKKERPKWRFLAKNLYKELIVYSREDLYKNEAAELLEKIYVMLCYSCDYILFSAYDSFESVGVPQTAFFEETLKALNSTCEKDVMIDKAIDLIVNNALNRYTLYEELMDILIGQLETVDMKYLLIEKCQLKRKTLTSKKPETSKFSSNYNFETLLNNLTTLIFKANAALFETTNGINDFMMHFIQSDPEIKLYILINLLLGFNEKDLIVQLIEDAKKNKMELRKSLLDLLEFIKTNNALPANIR